MPGLFCAQFSMRVPSVSARFSTLDTAVFVFSLSGTRSQSKRGRKRGERQRFPSPPPQKTRGNHSSHEPSLNLAPTSLSPCTTAASAPSASATPTRLDPNSGRNLDGPELSCPHPSGLLLPNPFVIGSGPPGTNRAVMRRAFLEGWGAVIAKTVSLDASKVFNVSPRYSKIKSRITGELIGWENIELISDRPFETMVRGRGRRGSCFGTLRFSSTFPFFDLSFLRPFLPPHISLSLSVFSRSSPLLRTTAGRLQAPERRVSRQGADRVDHGRIQRRKVARARREGGGRGRGGRDRDQLLVPARDAR